MYDPDASEAQHPRPDEICLVAKVADAHIDCHTT